jgi:hypothetical protein
MADSPVRNLLHPTVTDSGHPGDYPAGKWIWPDCCVAIGDSCSLFGRLRVQDRPDYVPFDGKTVFDSDEMIDK